MDPRPKHIAPREAARAYLDCAAEVGRRALSGIEGLDAMVAAADAVNDAADPVGLSLYAGYRGELLVDDTPGRALQIVTVLREFRGSAHLIALRACGVDARTAHFIKRPDDGPMFGWPVGFAPEISEDQRAAADRAEALTDDLVRPAYAVLDDDGAAALLRGLDDMAVALGGGTDFVASVTGAGPRHGARSPPGSRGEGELGRYHRASIRDREAHGR